MNLDLINAMDRRSRRRESFLRCCGSTRWAEQMADARPFESEDGHTGNRRADLVAARRGRLARGIRGPSPDRRPRRPSRQVRHRPPPGRAANRPARWGPRDEVLEDLAMGNRQYEERFGFIFIVCATGKTAEEMLALLGAAASERPPTPSSSWPPASR